MENKDLEQVIDQRREIFRPAWFKKLLAGKLGLGDTFWIGNFGIALVFVPILFLFATVLLAFASDDALLNLSLAIVSALMTIYYTLLVRAVFRAAKRTPEVGGWRWVGVGYTALQVIIAMLFTIFFTMLSI